MYLGPAGRTGFNTVWVGDVAPKIRACLHEIGVKWSSINIARVSTGENDLSAVTLWIGVRPESLLAEDAKTAAFRCLDIFKEFDITDIDVIICEEVLWGSAAARG